MMPKKIFNIFVFLLFLSCSFLFVFRSGMGGTDRIGGDEVASYISLLPFFHGLEEGKFIPTFLTYYHEPMQLIVQLPVVLFGASLFFVRLPNIILGILTFVVLYKISKKIFGDKSWYAICVLSLYTFSGFVLVLRMGIDAALFNFILALALMYLIDFEQTNKITDFKKTISLLVINLFVFIDGIFLFGFLFLNNLIEIKKNLRNLSSMWKMLTISGSIMFLWVVSVYVGSVFSGQYDWKIQAPFRLLTRGTSYSVFSSISNFTLALTFNSVEFTILIVGLLLISIFDRRAKSVWSLLAVPFIYFNLVAMPTLHMLNFWVLIILCVVLGLRYVCEKSNWVKYIFIFLLFFAFFKNIQTIKLDNPFDPEIDYKIAATYIRNNSNLCEKIYNRTNLDGYAFRFYFDRGYSEILTPGINFALVDGESRYLEASNFSIIAQIDRQNLEKLSVYKRGYQGSVTKLSFIEGNLFNYSNTLTYVSKCYFNK